MEHPRRPFPEPTRLFFHHLQRFLGVPVYFYGSVLRPDYFHGKSDIDVDIFTPDINFTVKQLRYFLKADKKDFKKFVYRLHNKMVAGYKMMYKDPARQLVTEISIYNLHVKDSILADQRRHIRMPWHVLVCMFVLKIIHYHLQWIERKHYRRFKNYLLHDMSGIPKDDFVIFQED
jgi:hypothetical protein